MAGYLRWPFLPMEHLVPAFKALCNLERGLHEGQPGMRRVVLLSGEQGIGKNSLVLLAMSDISRSRAASGSRETFTFHELMQCNRASEQGCFYSYLLESLAPRLHEMERFGAVAEAVERLGTLATEAEGSGGSLPLRQLQRLGLAKGGDAFARERDLLPPELLAVIQHAHHRGLSGMVNALLRQAGVAVIVSLQRPDCLFRESNFSFQRAELWLAQFRSVALDPDGAIGIVLCSNRPGVRSLFLSAGKPRAFPVGYSHLALCGSWGAGEIVHVRIPSPNWTRQTLMAYLLTHSCRSVQADFTLYARPESWTPSKAAMHLARTIDAVVQGGHKGKLPAGEKPLDAFLEHVLRGFGNVPILLSDVAFGLTCRGPAGRWPQPCCSRYDGAERVRDNPFVARAFGEFMLAVPAVEREKFLACTTLEFRRTDFVVPFETVLRELIRKDSAQAPAQPASGSAACDALASPVDRAHACIEAALDAGSLVQSKSGDLMLGSLGALHHGRWSYSNPRVAAWGRRLGNEHESRLPLARGLARMGSFSGEVLVKGAHGPEPSSGDSLSAELAVMHLVALDHLNGNDAIPLTSDAVTRAHVEQAFGSKVEEGMGGWGAAKAVGAAHGVHDVRALAAYLSLKLTHPSLWEYLTLQKGGFWLRESPYTLGGDLVGVYLELDVSFLIAHIVRVHTKRASQWAVEQGTYCTTTHHSMDAAVLDLTGGVPLSSATSEDTNRRHEPIFRAVGDLVIAAVLATIKMEQGVDVLSDWDAHFRAVVESNIVWAVDEGPLIATTLELNRTLRDRVLCAGIDVVDGEDFMKICESHEGAFGRLRSHSQEADEKSVKDACLKEIRGKLTTLLGL